MQRKKEEPFTKNVNKSDVKGVSGQATLCMGGRNKKKCDAKS